MVRLILSVGLALLLLLQTVLAQKTLPPLLPLDQEVALAESAAPAAITKDATIFVLHRGGFVLHRKGQNGFTCFVARTAPAEPSFLSSC